VKSNSRVNEPLTGSYFTNIY